MDAEREQDERLAKRTGSSDIRADRAISERSNTENREHTDSVRAEENWQAILRDTNTLLPTAPSIPGFHTCWLTTDNKKDPLEHRFRMGYSLVKRAELPDFCINSQKSGDITDDRITVNEMVLAKIPQEIWDRNIKYIHFDLPNDRARQLKDSVEQYRDSRGVARGAVGGMPDGFMEMARNRKFSLEGVK